MISEAGFAALLGCLDDNRSLRELVCGDRDYAERFFASHGNAPSRSTGLIDSR